MNNPIWRRYRDLLRPRPAADVDDEVRFHLDMREQEAQRAGLSADNARRAARERFGDVGRIVTELERIDGAREERRARAEWLDDLWQDARFALRSLRRAPAFAATAITTIAVAIAANTTIFSFVDALVLEPLPYDRPGELVAIRGGIVGSRGEALALRDRTRSFAALELYSPRTITLNDGGEAARVDGFDVTPNLFPMLGVRPLIGSAFAPNAGDPGNGTVVLLSHGLWQRRYGSDRAIVGRRISVDGVPYTICGVMPATFHFPSNTADFWIPLTIDRANTPSIWAWPVGWFVARLRSGVSIEQAQREIARVVPGMRRLNPMWDPGDDYGKSTVVRPFQQSLIGAARPALLLLSACVLVVLLIACVNVANLLLARATARERELGVRVALGGGRARLVRQLLTESVMLAALGGGAGVVLAMVGLRWTLVALPPDIPRIADIGLRGSVLAFSAVLTIATGIAFGLLPALRATSRRTAPDAARFGRAVGRGVAHHRLSAALVVGEVALAVLLVITAGLLGRSFVDLRDASPGFRTTHVVAARVSPPSARFVDKARATALYDAILARAAALPGVTDVAAVDRLPIAGPVYGIALRVEGQAEDVKRGLPWVDHLQTITPDYLNVFGIPVLRGRRFTAEDGPDAQPVALVSRSLARHFWPNDDALGKRIGYPFPSPWITIVGVVPDVRLDSLRDTSAMAVYIPFGQRFNAVRTGGGRPDMTILIRTSGDPTSVERTLRELVSSVDGTVPVSQIRTMDDVLSQSIAKPRFTVALVSGFALAALLLGAVGIYGVMSYLVSQRAPEMGVRVALGATTGDILRLVLGRGAALAGLGAMAGIGAALAATRPLRALLYGISASDPVTYATVALLFVAVALAASYGPARRATRADPVEALRSD